MAGDDFSLTAGWGHYGMCEAMIPDQGRIVERACTPEERADLGAAIPFEPDWYTLTSRVVQFELSLRGNGLGVFSALAHLDG